ncbi:MAG: ArsR family transcriptional regulator [Paenibacillus sp.]|jgi:rhodanese-related sulfurtransferase|nr:ArsR family transcriptional regulator [Paenibacillus sp.]
MQSSDSSTRAFNDELYQQFSRIGKCLSSDKRLELLNLLSQGPKTVEKLVQNTGMTFANASRHLQILLDARLVKFSKKGTYVIYELADRAVYEFLSSLWKVCEHQLADVKRIKDDLLNHFDEFQTVSMKELHDKLKAGTIVLLDVRPRDEYEADHIAGAISVPIHEIERHLQSLPRDVEIAAYCRGPYCIYSAQAVQLLRSEGFAAYRLEEGVQEWREYNEQKH